ncbi:MAG: hypothetical protein ABSG92_11065 [Conexivisphaerales archaeon]|jgi:hypothetical protein
MGRKTSEEEKVEEARRLHGELGYSIEGAAREAGLKRSKAAYHLQGQRRGPEPSGEEDGTCCPAVLKVVTRIEKDSKHNVKAIDHMAEDISELKWKAKEEERPPPEHAEKGNVKSEPSGQPSAANILVTGEPSGSPDFIGCLQTAKVASAVEDLTREERTQDMLGAIVQHQNARGFRRLETGIASVAVGQTVADSKLSELLRGQAELEERVSGLEDGLVRSEGLSLRAATAAEKAISACNRPQEPKPTIIEPCKIVPSSMAGVTKGFRILNNPKPIAQDSHDATMQKLIDLICKPDAGRGIMSPEELRLMWEAAAIYLGWKKGNTREAAKILREQFGLEIPRAASSVT